MDRLKGAAFIEQWLVLYRECPWATPFQHPAFVNTWYACYRGHGQAVVVAGFDDTKLVGLLLLAEYGGALVGAGANQAEYQVWLALPVASKDFAPLAVAAACAAVPRVPFCLKYVPGDAPAADVVDDRALAGLIQVRRHSRPLMRLDPAEITASLKKKSNASRLQRLRREGAVAVERIVDARALAPIFDEIIALYDFRQGAINDDCPFADDPQKKAFHLDWMAAAGDQLQVTVLQAKGRIVSALFGVRSRDTVHVAILTHSPFFANHSPGKFHLMLTGLDLAASGIRFLDLTPGGVWKQRFADTSDEVLELRVHRYAARRALADWSNRARSGVKRAIRAAGYEPPSIEATLKAARHVDLGAAMNALGAWVKHDAELRIYRIRPDAAPPPEPGFIPQKDGVEALLKLEPAETRQSRQSFLKTALDRLESGQQIFTITRGGRLEQYLWLADERRGTLFSALEQSFPLTEPGAVLYDFYATREARKSGLERHSLSHVLRSLAEGGTVRQVFACVFADDESLRLIIEAIGFEYVGSLWHRRRFGRSVRWRTVAESSIPA